MGEWQPIETATEAQAKRQPVQLYRPAATFGTWAQRVTAIWFDDPEWGCWVWPKDQVNDGWWDDIETLVDEDGLYECNGTFTHWMPLPEPPHA